MTTTKRNNDEGLEALAAYTDDATEMTLCTLRAGQLIYMIAMVA